jgi:hypothetical protein
MKIHFFSAAIFFCAFIFYCGNAQAQWVPLNIQIPPYDTYITAFTVFNGNIITESGSEGLFISNDNGAHWNPIDDNCDGSIACFATLGRYLYAGGSGVSIYTSSNNGYGLIKKDTALSNVGVSCLTIYGDSLLAGTSDGV